MEMTIASFSDPRRKVVRHRVESNSQEDKDFRWYFELLDGDSKREVADRVASLRTNGRGSSPLVPTTNAEIKKGASGSDCKPAQFQP